jgi:MurNAc alpha-1-phosphate uridylyltransferase
MSPRRVLADAPTRAMVLAAGLGLRMRPITDKLPKPLVKLAGRALLDRALDALAAAGVTDAVVNTHYLPHMIEEHVAARASPRIRISREDALLETGGGVTAALAHLGAAPFYVANADIAWEDGPVPALARLAAFWDDDAMDALLLLQPTDAAPGYDGAGDFTRDDTGRLARRSSERAPFVFTGVQMLHPRLFAGAPDGAFSMNLLYDRALAAGRLFGLVHDAAWYHVGTPAALAEAEALIALHAAPGTG